MRSQFVSSVSHELKTPLTSIRAFAESLKMGRPEAPEKKGEYLDTIISESERLTRLLNNVLDFSRIEQGRKTYNIRSGSVAAVVQAAIRSVEYPLAQRGFTLRVRMPDEPLIARVDPDAIEQAILNLLSNAVKYSGESREIELRLRRQGDTAILEVEDWGMGIPTEEQARIFEKFHRVRAAEDLGIPGTGLGLTVVAHIARAHDARVEVESTPSKGSTFLLHLPLEVRA